MKSRYFAALAATILTLSAQHAIALSHDDQTLTASDGSPRFSDPDDKTPSAIFLGEKSPSSGSVDPSTVRYDYDPSSGNYIQHKN